MTVWICGNSHTAALKRGLSQLQKNGLEIDVFPLGNGKWEKTPFSVTRENIVEATNSQYRKNLQRFTGATNFRADCVWGLCMGTHNARIYRDEFWAGAEPAAIARPGVRPISDGVLDSIVEADQFHIRDFILRLKNGGVKCFVVSCPPPRLDHSCLTKGVRSETVAYIDRCARASLQGWLIEHGVDFIAPPAETMTDDGFLKAEYAATLTQSGRKDPHHANKAYGALLMERVISHCSRS